MYRGLLIIITLLFISGRPLQSNASPVDLFRNLAEQNKISPSPSPASGVNLTSGGQNVKETCKMGSRSCQQKKMIACLHYPESGNQGSSLLVLNDGESSMKVKIIILPENNTIKEIQLSSHQTEKISILANVGVGASIVLNAGDGDCIIHIEAPAPQNNHYAQFPSYHIYITPMNGAYLLFLVTIISGGTWACCKLRERARRHLDGVPYQELEMGNSTALSSMDVEAVEGWDQDWDEEWDEEKAVKSPEGNDERTKPANGFGSKPLDSNGWGNDWDD